MAERKTLVVIPTYNEAENISRLLPAVLQQDAHLHILVVDDGSPDGTAQVVQRAMASEPRIHLIQRPGKLGLGTAYVAGFRYAIQERYDCVFEMDADFSHNPEDIPRLLEKIGEYDLVLGSRYIHGIRVVNWPMSRLLLSYFANIYSRVITGLPLCDATGGFKCFRRSVLEAVDLDGVKSNGYAFQIEMSFKAWKKGFSIVEVPIIFLDRRAGVSKMSKKIVREAMLMVWRLRFRAIVNRV